LGVPLKDSDRAFVNELHWFPHALHFAKDPRSGFELKREMEPIDGHDCYVITWPNRLKMWVDPTVNYWIRKLENYNGGPNPQWRFRLGEFKEVIPDVWLPMRFKQEILVIGIDGQPEKIGQPIVTTHGEVLEISINEVKDEDFFVEIPAGTLVIDRINHRDYQLPANVDDVFSQLAQESLVFGKQGSGKLFWAFFYGAVIAVLCVVAVTLFRRRTSGV
jgi:hypothetical protein